MVLDPGILVPLSSAFRWLLLDNGWHSTVNVSSFDPVLSFVVYYRSDGVYWSTIYLHDPIMLKDFVSGLFPQLPQEVIPGRKHALGYCLSNRPLCLVQGHYYEGPSLTPDEEVDLFATSSVGRAWLVGQLHPPRHMVH